MAMPALIRTDMLASLDDGKPLPPPGQASSVSRNKRVRLFKCQCPKRNLSVIGLDIFLLNEKEEKEMPACLPAFIKHEARKCSPFPIC